MTFCHVCWCTFVICIIPPCCPSHFLHKVIQVRLSLMWPYVHKTPTVSKVSVFTVSTLLRLTLRPCTQVPTPWHHMKNIWTKWIHWNPAKTAKCLLVWQADKIVQNQQSEQEITAKFRSLPLPIPWSKPRRTVRTRGTRNTAVSSNTELRDRQTEI